MREGAPLRGSAASLREAANRSSIGFVLSIAIAFRRERLPANFFAILRRRLFFSIELVFAIRLSLPFPRLKRVVYPFGVIFSENRYPLFGITLSRLTAGTEN